ncbi:MAG: MMPL family transporter [Bacteroidales bacterium]|nr:MMPL family transporter [Bacteroidales bacterium]
MKTKIIAWLANVVVKYYKAVLGIVLLITVIAAILSENLVLKMNMKDMMPQSHPIVKEFNFMVDNFEAASSIMITAIGETEDLKKFADEVAPQIAALDEYIYQVDHKVNQEFLKNHALMLVKSKDLKSSKETFKHLGLVKYLEAMNNTFEETYIADGEESLSNKQQEFYAIAALDGIKTWLLTMNDYMNDDNIGIEKAKWAVDNMLFGEEYMLSPKKDMIIITAFPKFTIDDMDRSKELISHINEIINKTAKKYDGIRDVGIAGAMAIGVDEVKAAESDMNVTSLIAFVLIIVMFIVSFRMWISPMLAGVSLIIGIIWTTGFAALTVGSLNMMTSIFGVILIGLGIGFNIYIISGYIENRSKGMSIAEAVKTTFSKTGNAILIGATTTSLAFFTLMVSENIGMKEFGLISGVGILLTMLASFVVLPALLTLFDKIKLKKVNKLQNKLENIKLNKSQYLKLKKKYDKKTKTPKTPAFGFLGNVSTAIGKRPVIYLSVALTLTVIMIFSAKNISFNYDFLSLEPEGLQSIKMQDSIMEKFDMSPDMIFISVNSIEESREIAEKVKDNSKIGFTGSISDYIPSDEQYSNRLPYLKEINKYLKNNVADTLKEEDIDVLIDELYRLEDNIIEMAQMAYAGGQDKLDNKTKEITGDLEKEAKERKSIVSELVNKIDEDRNKATGALKQFQNHYEPYLRNVAISMSSTEKITLDLLPDDILSQFMSKDKSRFMLSMYPNEQVWDLTFLEQFSDQMHKIDERITGSPIIYYILITLIAKDGALAAILTLIVVFLLLLFDFRNLKLALLTMIPLILGTIWMIGTMNAIGMQLNLLNVMGLPLILGIGIDYGVHIIHRYKIEGSGKLKTIFSSIGKAVFFAALTTLLAFGSLGFSTSRGLASMGFTLAIGIITILTATLVILPAIISLIDNKSNKSTK